MRRAVFLLGFMAAAAIGSPPASAMDKNQSFIILGPGSVSCGAWTERRRSESSGPFQFWLLGYITGINQFAAFGIEDISEGTDASGLFGWIDNWCRDHPLDTLNKAATHLAIDLQVKHFSKPEPINQPGQR